MGKAKKFSPEVKALRTILGASTAVLTHDEDGEPVLSSGLHNVKISLPRVQWLDRRPSWWDMSPAAFEAELAERRRERRKRRGGGSGAQASAADTPPDEAIERSALHAAGLGHP